MKDDGMEAHFAALREFIHERFRVVDTKLDRVIADVGDLKQRMTAVEAQIVATRRDIISVEEAVAHQSARLDLIETRLYRIERRLVDPA